MKHEHDWTQVKAWMCSHCGNVVYEVTLIHDQEVDASNFRKTKDYKENHPATANRTVAFNSR